MLQPLEQEHGVSSQERYVFLLAVHGDLQYFPTRRSSDLHYNGRSAMEYVRPVQTRSISVYYKLRRQHQNETTKILTLVTVNLLLTIQRSKKERGPLLQPMLARVDRLATQHCSIAPSQAQRVRPTFYGGPFQTEFVLRAWMTFR